jgi:hypothetical protein
MLVGPGGRREPADLGASGGPAVCYAVGGPRGRRRRPTSPGENDVVGQQVDRRHAEGGSEPGQLREREVPLTAFHLSVEGAMPSHRRRNGVLAEVVIGPENLQPVTEFAQELVTVGGARTHGETLAA